MLLLFIQCAYCQFDYSLSNSILNKTEKYLATFTREAAYLHFDKPYYLPGDTVNFAAYVIMSEKHIPSNISGVLYVDLTDSKNDLIRSLKIRLFAGFASGNIALPDSLDKGLYHVRAYTNWMKNDNISGAFDHTFFVGSNQTLSKGLNTTLKNTEKPDLQFFPEGGNLVYGIRSKVAFKAVGSNGRGLSFKGKIIDNDNNEVILLEPTHLGMGCVLFQPKEGKTYKAKVKYSNGLEDMVSLPKPSLSGMVLAVDNDSIPKTTVKVLLNQAFYDQNKNKRFIMLIYSNGTATTVDFKLDSMNTKFDILKRRLQTGVASVTLFSDDGVPIAERLFFVQNFDQLRLVVTSDKLSYKKRENVKINLRSADANQDPVGGHFSVSVIDKKKLHSTENNESTIMTYYLLTSDLKGNIEQPNYYFGAYNEKATTDLDLIMLTHGYRRFEWKEVLNNNPLVIGYQPEKGLEISGLAKTTSGKLLDKGTISLIASSGGPVLSKEIDKNGGFRFNNLVFYDTTAFMLSAVKSNGSNSTQLTYKSEIRQSISSDKLNLILSYEETDIESYLQNKHKQAEVLNKLGLGKSIMLKEVQIRGNRSKPVVNNPKYGPADFIITDDQLGYGGSLALKLAGLVHRPGYYTKPPLIVWNGIEMPAGFRLDDINTGSVKSIDVFRHAVGSDYEGILVINTSFGMKARDVVATGILPIKVIGFEKARTFYSPKYGNNESINALSDLRTTIFWNPNIITDQNGNADFNFYNAEGNSTYKISIEGIDDKGRVGRSTYRFKVE